MGTGVGKLSAPHRITSGCLTEGFDCGKPKFNEFIQGALKNQTRHNAVCFVVTDETSKVVGFYTLSSHSIQRQSPARPKDLFENAPDPVPTVLFGRFAVSLDWQGKGLGSDLLRDALLRIAEHSVDVAVRAVIVDPDDEKNRAFYEKLGFKPIGGGSEPNRLYLATKNLRATIESLGE